MKGKKRKKKNKIKNIPPGTKSYKEAKKNNLGVCVSL